MFHFIFIASIEVTSNGQWIITEKNRREKIEKNETSCIIYSRLNVKCIDAENWLIRFPCTSTGPYTKFHKWFINITTDIRDIIISNTGDWWNKWLLPEWKIKEFINHMALCGRFHFSWHLDISYIKTITNIRTTHINVSLWKYRFSRFAHRRRRSMWCVFFCINLHAHTHTHTHTRKPTWNLKQKQPGNNVQA